MAESGENHSAPAAGAPDSGNPPAQVSFTNTNEDFAAWLRYYYKKTPQGRRAGCAAHVLIHILVGFVVAVTWAWNPVPGVLVLVVALVCLAVLWISTLRRGFCGVYLAGDLKSLPKSLNYAAWTSQKTIGVTEDGIECQELYFRGSVNRDAIPKAVVSDDYLLIFWWSKPYIVPRRVFPDGGSCRKFIDALRNITSVEVFEGPLALPWMRPKLRKPPPVWAVTIGIVSIVLGSFLLMGALISGGLTWLLRRFTQLLEPLAEAAFTKLETSGAEGAKAVGEGNFVLPYFAVTAAANAIWLGLAIVLLVAGIALVRRKTSARRLHLAFAWITALFLVLRFTAEITMQSLSGGGLHHGMTLTRIHIFPPGCTLVSLLLGLLYPLFLLLWFSRTKIKQEVQQWHEVPGHAP